MRNFRLLLTVTIVLLMPAIAIGSEETSQNPAEKTEENTGKSIITLTSIPVAIIDFESKAPGNPEFGQQLGNILTARMSIYDQFKLVEREKLEELLKEHQLGLTGMVDTNQAIKVGKMLGAKIMVFGRAFPVDKDLYIVAKIVGTETSQVKGVIAKGKMESNLSDIIDQLVDKLVDGLEKWAPQLLPQNEKLQNKIEILKKQLANKNLPAVAVAVPERHINRQVADPAAETEIKKIFKEVGFKIIEVKREIVAKWARDFQKDPGVPVPGDFAGVDIVISGEGISEFGARMGGLVSCVARLEVQATDKESREIIASERTTRRAVDLSEAIAAKTALQAAGHELAIKAIEKIAEKINKEQGADSPKSR